MKNWVRIVQVRLGDLDKVQTRLKKRLDWIPQRIIWVR